MSSRRPFRVLALIPARGGSKGVKRKNIRSVGGKPLIAHSILAGRKSRRVTDVAVSTDDRAIERAARRWGAEVLRRPKSLAGDKTPMAPVALHALDTLARDGRSYDALILLQPTCPLRTAADVDAALDLLRRSGAPAVIGVYRVFDQHPGRMYRIVRKRLAPYDRALEKMNRQDLPAVYHRNGLIYAVRADVFRRKRTFMPAGSVPLEMPRERSVNIDEELDLLFADFLLKRRRAAHP